jgi:hypothetical protein
VTGNLVVVDLRLMTADLPMKKLCAVDKSCHELKAFLVIVIGGVMIGLNGIG